MESKMTKTPWKTNDTYKQDGNISLMGANKMQIGNLFQSMKGVDNTPGNASAIVSAVNNTWGKGIDPSSVPELLEALKEIIRTSEETCFEVERTTAFLKAKAAIDKAIIK